MNFVCTMQNKSHLEICECFKKLNDVFAILMVLICCFSPMTISNDFKAKHSCLQTHNGLSFYVQEIVSLK